MNTQLQSLFDALENSRKELLQQVAPLSEAQLNWQSSPERWSVAQIIEHLTLAEKYMLENIQERLQESEKLKQVGFKSYAKLYLMKLIVRSPFKPKVKAPARLAAVANHNDLNSLVENWDGKRQKLQEILSKITPDMFDKNLTSHPLVPDLTIKQGLGILQGHFNIHRKQIEGVMAARLGKI